MGIPVWPGGDTLCTAASPFGSEIGWQAPDGALVLGPDAVVQDCLPAHAALLQGLLSDRGPLSAVVGELRGQATDGRGTLANTASARL